MRANDIRLRLRTEIRRRISRIELDFSEELFPIVVNVQFVNGFTLKGKEAEVCGRVVSVTTSPLGTAFINFGGEYPNQTFAGFIAAGSRVAADQRLTMIQRENHQHRRDNPNSRRQAGDRGRVGRPGQRLEFSDGMVSRQRHPRHHHDSEYETTKDAQHISQT
jgi:hypothetical protein